MDCSFTICFIERTTHRFTINGNNVVTPVRNQCLYPCRKFFRKSTGSRAVNILPKVSCEGIPVESDCYINQYDYMIKQFLNTLKISGKYGKTQESRFIVKAGGECVSTFSDYFEKPVA